MEKCTTSKEFLPTLKNLQLFLINQFSKSEESFLNGGQNPTNNRTALSNYIKKKNLVEIIAFKSGRINKSTIDYIITQMQIYLNNEE